MAATMVAVHAAMEFFVGRNEMSIDNWTFKLFYKWSTAIFVFSRCLRQILINS